MRRILGILIVMSLVVLTAQAADVTKFRTVDAARKSGASAFEEVRTGWTSLPPVGSRRPGTLDEVIISEGFETTDTTSLPDGWMQVSVDNGNSPVFNGRPSEWQVISRTGLSTHSGSKIVCNGYNTGGSANDDWLILPQVPALTAPISLSFWVSSQDPAYLENYQIRVSTTGTLPANFTNVVATVTNTPQAWTQRTYDLSAYAGAPFYVAIRYNSTDEFVIKVDDLVLTGVTGGPHGALSGLVNDELNNPVSDVLVTLLGSGMTDTTSATGLYFFPSLTPGTYHASFVKHGYVTRVDSNIIITADDTTQHITQLVASHIVDLVNEDFEAIELGALPDGWTQISVDAGTSPIFEGPSEWQVLNGTGYTAHSGDNFVANAYNNPVVTNDDWLILPQVPASSGPITLTYWLSSQDPDYLENYQVRVSTTGNQPANFTNLIYTGTDAPNPWTEHNHDLSAYAGAPFWVAFHYVSRDEFVIKVDDVVLTAGQTAAGDEPAVLPNSFTFAGNYPNPFNATTEFRFTLAQPGQTSLVLFNTLGQEVARILEAPLAAGAHTVPFNAATLPTGTYYARLTSSGATATHKMMLLK